MNQILSTNKNRNAGPIWTGGRWLVPVICLMLCALYGAADDGVIGTVNRASGWYPAGSNLTVTATPGTFSQFDAWAGDTNGLVITGNEASFKVTGSREITAIFKAAVTSTNAVPYRWLADQNKLWTNDFEALVVTDSDGDGFTTGQEYWSGTDPTDANSFLHIAGFTVGPTNARIEWAHAKIDEAKGGIPSINVEWRASMMTGEWVKVGEKLPVNGINSFEHFVQNVGFYRLTVTNMP